MTAATPTTDQAATSRWLTIQTPHVAALTLWVLSLFLFWKPLINLANLSFYDENSSHILLIPVVSAFLAYLQRKRIFHSPRYCPSLGVPVLLAAVVLRYGLEGPLGALSGKDRLAILTALLVVGWCAIFLLCYGPSSFKTALFPLFYLFLMVPLPVVVSEHLIYMLQKSSADVCYGLFRFLGVPVLRHGFVFSLPGVNIEVARQCSGIHSALSLLIVGLLAAQFVLHGAWRKLCFALCILPIAIFKNAVRIVTIAWIGIRVNPAVFQGPLHRQGGLPFSLVALALMIALLWLLRRPFDRPPVQSRPNLG